MKHRTGEEILKLHGVTKEYLLRKAKLYYIMHNKEYWANCSNCLFGKGSEGECCVTDWRKYRDDIILSCLFKFMPKRNNKKE